MKIKKDFVFRKVGTDYMAVAVGKASKEFKGIIRTNATGAFLWEALKEETTEDEVVAKMLDHYDIDEENARKELARFLDQIKIAIE